MFWTLLVWIVIGEITKATTPGDVSTTDALVKIEEAERRADEEDYAVEKQRLLNIQKNRVR